MPSEVYEEIPLPNGQRVTITRRGGRAVELHLVSKAKYFRTLEEAYRYADTLKESARLQMGPLQIERIEEQPPLPHLT